MHGGVSWYRRCCTRRSLDKTSAFTGITAVVVRCQGQCGPQVAAETLDQLVTAVCLIAVLCGIRFLVQEWMTASQVGQRPELPYSSSGTLPETARVAINSLCLEHYHWRTAHRQCARTVARSAGRLHQVSSSTYLVTGI